MLPNPRPRPPLPINLRRGSNPRVTSISQLRRQVAGDQAAFIDLGLASTAVGWPLWTNRIAALLTSSGHSQSALLIDDSCRIRLIALDYPYVLTRQSSDTHGFMSDTGAALLWQFRPTASETDRGTLQPIDLGSAADVPGLNFDCADYVSQNVTSANGYQADAVRRHSSHISEYRQRPRTRLRLP